MRGYHVGSGAALLTDPDTDRYGLDLMRDTGLTSGSLYPILHRLQDAGWLTTRCEDIEPAERGRPARRFYRLTPDGVQQAQSALARLRAQTAVPGIVGLPRRPDVRGPGHHPAGPAVRRRRSVPRVGATVAVRRAQRRRPRMTTDQIWTVGDTIDVDAYIFLLYAGLALGMIMTRVLRAAPTPVPAEPA